MDDSGDREYSRTPQIQDVLKLCRALNDQGVQYILIGGFAVILHGFVRGTKDIDLLVDASKENVKKLKKGMAVLADNAVSLIADDEVEKYQVVRIADEIVVDLMAKACGIDYRKAQEGIEWIEIEGVKIPIAAKEWLIRMKDTIRPSDHMDVNYLKQRIWQEEQRTSGTEKKQPSFLMKIISKFK